MCKPSVVLCSACESQLLSEHFNAKFLHSLSKSLHLSSYSFAVLDIASYTSSRPKFPSSFKLLKSPSPKAIGHLPLRISCFLCPFCVVPVQHNAVIQKVTARMIHMLMGGGHMQQIPLHRIPCIETVCGVVILIPGKQNVHVSYDLRHESSFPCIPSLSIFRCTQSPWSCMCLAFFALCNYFIYTLK